MTLYKQPYAPRTNRFTQLILAMAIVLTAIVTTPPAQAEDQVGWITFDGPLLEEPNPFGWLIGEDSSDTVRGMLSKFDDAASRIDVQGLVLHLKDLQANTSQIFALRNGIKRVRNAGKPVFVYAEVYGPGELILGCAADKMLIQNSGYVSFPGLYSEEMYLADTLQMVGLKADYVQVGAYKGASEPMARSAPSKEWSENVNHLLDDVWAQMKDAVQKGRGYSDDQMAMVLDKAWMLEADKAIELGLIDDAIDVTDLKDYVMDAFGGAKITTRIGDEGNSSQFDMENPFSLLSILTSEPDHSPKRNTIAVIHVNGPIIDGESQHASMFGGTSVGSRTLRKALSKIEDENLIKGLVIRINSPGGSALASEVIWQGVRRVAEKKPVYVSVGSMAASGGYYIAVSGDRIYVDPVSIVGSIGVVGGKIVWGGLYNKVNLGITARSRGPKADMFGSLNPWSEEQRGLVHQMMKKTYDQFTNRVLQGRNHKVDLSKIAEGRLFTGRQAIKNGMADGIAEFDDVIARLAGDVGLPENSYDVMTYPGPMSFKDMIEQALPFAGVMSPVQGAAARDAAMDQVVRGAGAAVLRQILGRKNWPQLRDALNGLMIMKDEPVVLISPRTLIIN